MSAESLVPLLEIVSLLTSGDACYLQINSLHELTITDMSDSQNQVPALFYHPHFGQIRALTSFAPDTRQFLEDMIAQGVIRCIWHEGYQFVPLNEVEHYSVTELDGDAIAHMMLPAADHSSGATLLGAVEAQASKDEIIREKQAGLIKFARANLAPTFHPFAQVRWMAFWSDAADVGANLAGDEEVQKIANAMSFLEESAANGTIDSIGLPHFHRVLLSLAAPELDKQFDAIWSPGCGRLEIKDPKRQPMVGAVLRRLTATFTGYRGDPEGSETPSQLMNRYLDLMSLSAAG